jgi:molybdate transport system substrate-binding protein
VCTAGQALAAEVRVAVAANFVEAAREIAHAFERESGHRVLMSFGSTGQLYAQISQAAPFEVFLAADQERPALAVREGLALPGSRFTYATGRLVLYSPDPQRVSGPDTLRTARFTRLAIANPATAPYGAAALQVLRRLGVYETLAERLVRGNNIAQAYQFVATGNAELGFVAQSQLARVRGGSRWRVPVRLHPPVAQDAVLLANGRDNPAAGAFLAYLRSPEATDIIRTYGYGTGD